MNSNQLLIQGQLLYALDPQAKHSVRLFSTVEKDKHYLGRAILDEKGNFSKTVAKFKVYLDPTKKLPRVEARFTLGGLQYHLNLLPFKEIAKNSYHSEIKLSQVEMQKARDKFRSLNLKIESLKQLETYQKDLAILMREVPNGANLFAIAPARFLMENGIQVTEKARNELRTSMKIVGPVPTTKYDLLARGLEPKIRINL
jgi:hypothetical protein